MTAYRAETLPGLTRVLAELAKAGNALVSAGKIAVFEVKEGKRKRTDPQNSKMWPMLGDISEQVIWHGQKLSDEDWKDLLTAALKRQRSAPGIDGGLVFFGSRTSEMDTETMSDLIELMYSFGSERNVKWSEPG